LTRALLLLTFSTGLVDAASYLGLGHVFAANMTGNVVLLGFGIAGAGGLPVVAPIVSLCGFLLGAGVGGRLAIRPAGSPQRRLATATIVEGGMLLAATVLSAVVHLRVGAFSGDAVIALLAMGMGTRNAVVRALGVPDLTTTVLTMTLTALAAESPPFGGPQRLLAQRGRRGHGVTGCVARASSRPPLFVVYVTASGSSAGPAGTRSRPSSSSPR
jgi:uncharacterized membrane protein YoaK (UPF0700 family)